MEFLIIFEVGGSAWNEGWSVFAQNNAELSETIVEINDLRRMVVPSIHGTKTGIGLQPRLSPLIPNPYSQRTSRQNELAVL